MKNIKITISGETGCGKSTIMFLILKMLREKGFGVDFTDPDYPTTTELNRILGENVEHAVDGLKYITHIDIEQIQLQRKPNIS